MTFEMEKYFRRVSPEMQAKADRVLELNPDHPVFAALQLAVAQDPEKAKKYVDEHTDIIHFNGKFKPWKSDYKGELDGYWHHFDRMPSCKARRYYSETA